MDACDWQTGEFRNAVEMQITFELLLNLHEARAAEYDRPKTRGRPPRPVVNIALLASAIQFWRDDLKRKVGETHDAGNRLYAFASALSAPLPHSGGLTEQGFRQFQRTMWKDSFSNQMN